MKAQDNVILTTAKDQLAVVDQWGGGKDETFFVYSHIDGRSTNSPIPLQPIHRQRTPEQPLLLVRWPGGRVSGGGMSGSALPPEASWAGLSSTSSSVPSWPGRSHHGHCVPSGFGQPHGLFGRRSQFLPVQSYARG
ncbi:hypothetical protein E2C01_004915 [Portunus trituberculatus]|uniref:Uncharacterized protein n=1 Tax=Portunus trituberculatus TaxID=210409 RepID=A0A5B7CSL8_PORTR|nr:hypothetical protein [Portunus trituberculatus]